MKKISATKIVSGLLTLVMFCFAWACNKSHDVSPTSLSAETPDVSITVKEGILVFPSQEVFDKTMIEMRSAKDNPYEKVGNFVSLKSVLGKLTDKDFDDAWRKNMVGYENILSVAEVNGEKEIVYVVEDNALASLLNENGVLQIANKLVKVTRNKVYRAEFPLELVGEFKILRIVSIFVVTKRQKYDCTI